MIKLRRKNIEYFKDILYNSIFLSLNFERKNQLEIQIEDFIEKDERNFKFSIYLTTPNLKKKVCVYSLRKTFKFNTGAIDEPVLESFDNSIIRDIWNWGIFGKSIHSEQTVSYAFSDIANNKIDWIKFEEL